MPLPLLPQTLPRRAAAAGALALLAAALAAAVAFAPRSVAQPLSPMTVPPCQCSVATALVSGAGAISHCICGAATCAIVHATGQPLGAGALQCVK